MNGRSRQRKQEKKTDVETKETIEELVQKLDQMHEDKKNKCKAAKEQLVDMLEVTVDKYRTVTGTAEAIRMLRFVGHDGQLYLQEGVALSKELAGVCQQMVEKAKSLEPAEMDELCKGFYSEEFELGSTDEGRGIHDIAFEMMRVDLCRNVGGAAEDMVSFCKRTDEEIRDTEFALAELRASEESD